MSTRFGGWDPGIDMNDDDFRSDEAGSLPPLRGFAHSERCKEHADRADAAEADAIRLAAVVRAIQPSDAVIDSCSEHEVIEIGAYPRVFREAREALRRHEERQP